MRLRERGERWCKGKRSRRVKNREMEMASEETLEETGCVVWWERWGIAVVAQVWCCLCWLQMRTHASQLLARDKPKPRRLTGKCHHDWRSQRSEAAMVEMAGRRLALRRHTL